MKLFSLSDVLEDARQNGGGTYFVISTGLVSASLSSVQHNWGFYASVHGGIENLPDGAFIGEVVMEFIETMSQGGYLGLWRDSAGKWSVDETLWFGSKSDAVYFADHNEQRAIWDIENGSEIVVSERSLVSL